MPTGGMTPAQGSLLIQGGRLVDPSQEIDAPRDVRIVDGLVAEIGEALEPGDSEVLDASGKVVAPGFIDIHVHLREPGFEYKETVETGARAAAAGGFVAVACMANTDPVNDNVSVTEHILEQAKRAGYARVYPIGAISKGLEGKALAEIGLMVGAGAVAVSDDGLPVCDAELMRRALLHSQHYDIPVVQHCEDHELTGKGVMHEGHYSSLLGVEGIPGASDDVVIARDLEILAETGGRYHVAHISTRRGVEMVREAKRRGLPVTTEVSAHHLLLTDEDVYRSKLDPNFKMHPPLRSAEDREALVEGLLDGTIDCIASDHAPHHEDEKGIDFVAAPNGIVGLETTVPLCLDRLVRASILDLGRLIDLLSTQPARVFGIPGGSLAAGSPGDATILDLEIQQTVEPGLFRSRSRNTPFTGWELQGAAAQTVVAGRVIDVEA